MLVWVFVARSPLIDNGLNSKVDVGIFLYPIIMQGSVLSGLDDSIERFRYGLAPLDYLADTLNDKGYCY